MRIIAYVNRIENGQVYLEESTGEKCRTTRLDWLLDFLLEPFDEAHMKVCWNLDGFVAPLLRLLGKDACRELSEPEHKVFVRPYSLFYIPGKVFSIRRGRYQATLYGIDQYFPDTEEPGEASTLGGLGDYLVAQLERMGLQPRKLTSPVAIYEDSLLSHMDVPTIAEMPENALECARYAYNCCGRLWISNFKVGHWDTAFEYDIASAFPYEAAHLYSTRHCKYQKSKRYVEGAHWGFLRGRVTIWADVSPIVYRMGDWLICPKGTWDTFLTLDEVRFIEKWGIGKFELKDGWFLTFTAPIHPLEVPMQKLFVQRMENETCRLLSKRMAVGVYGKFIEQHDDGSYGWYFNPMYAAQISTRVRLRVADFIYNHKLQDSLLSVAVDSVLLDGYAGKPKGSGMGAWRLSNACPVFVLSPGLVFYGDKHPKGFSYDLLMRLITDKPRAYNYEAWLPRRVTLGEALDGRWGELGEMRSFRSAIDLHLLHQDRHFARMPKMGETLLGKKFDSKALTV
jgi:hypothetical protein